MRRKRKIIEVIEGYVTTSIRGQISSGTVFGIRAWDLPIIYKDLPDPDNFRKVRMTFEEIK